MTFNKLNIKNLQDWFKGTPLEARRFQQVVDALKALGGVSPGSQKIDTGRIIQLKMFKVVKLEQDVIICNTWNGIEKGTDEIKVAMPFLIRRTPFDEATRTDPKRANITYVYSDFNLRLATDEDDETEDQIIVASYELDDIIYAMKGIFGGTSLYHDDPANETPVIWLDTNVDGRFWALDDDPPEEES